MITARLPLRSRSLAISAMAVAAVVLQPSESSIADTRNGPKKVACTSSRIFSPAPTSEPPTQTAIDAVAGRAREERSLDEILHGVRRHAAVAEQDVDAGVVRHDRVEGARMWIGVEL